MSGEQPACARCLFCIEQTQLLCDVLVKVSVDGAERRDTLQVAPLSVDNAGQGSGYRRGNVFNAGADA